MRENNFLYIFLDTCLLLGFVFCTDPWHTDSLVLFDEDFKFMYSDNVDLEFNKKYYDFLDEQVSFYSCLESKLKNMEEDISLSDLKDIALNLNLSLDFAENKKEECIKTFWNYCNFDEYCSANVLHEKLIVFRSNYSRTIENRFYFLNSILTLMDMRKEQYKSIKDNLESVGAHYPDIDIVLDAHDFSFKIKEDLSFLTADNKLIKKCKLVDDLNLNLFYIKEFIKDYI